MYFPPANFLNYTCATVSAILGLYYLFKPTFMQYHKEALVKNWEELEKTLQTLILALMRAVSGGALLLAYIILVLQIEYDRQGHRWIPLTILIATIIFSFCSIYAMLLVTSRTKGRPPVHIIILCLALAFFGYILQRMV